MATKQGLKITLSNQAKQHPRLIQEQGGFSNETTAIEQAIACLYEDLQRRHNPDANPYIFQANLSPDDFE